MKNQKQLPQIPEKMKRVLASDHGVHDIPEDRMKDARKLDPNLVVLNP